SFFFFGPLLTCWRTAFTGCTAAPSTCEGKESEFSKVSTILGVTDSSGAMSSVEFWSVG
ncbi:hypothetical protein M9458_012059, partial [Cirrhinus mrigala]